MMGITVVGSTTWGTTLALLLARNGQHVWLLTRSHAEAEGLEADRENRRALPGITFPALLSVVGSPIDCLPRSQAVFIAVPSQFMRRTVQALGRCLPDDAIVVSAAKGLELGSAKRMSQVIAEELPSISTDRILALSGPNLAKEIAMGLPASSVIGGPSPAGDVVQSLLISPLFRVYTNPDIVGVELGGALKNIIAVGAGISDGLGYGDNAKAGLITRGLAEMTRLGIALGAERVTMMGLSGLGDLIATCSSTLSRNHFVGEQLARGRSLRDIQAGMRNVAEGVATTAAATALSQRLQVSMPITEQMDRVLSGELDPAQAVLALMQREPKPEFTEA